MTYAFRGLLKSWLGCRGGTIDRRAACGWPLKVVMWPGASPSARSIRNRPRSSGCTVRPAFRGRGVGRTLAEYVLRAASAACYRRVCLDTLPSMAGAIALYRSLGFTEVSQYCHNPVPGAIFLGRELA